MERQTSSCVKAQDWYDGESYHQLLQRAFAATQAVGGSNPLPLSLVRTHFPEMGWRGAHH